MSGFALTVDAVADLEEIETYIAQDDVDQALHVVENLHAAMQTLAENPGLGRKRPELDPDRTLRFWPVHAYLIVYRPETDPIQVLRVVSGYRDIPALLP